MSSILANNYKTLLLEVDWLIHYWMGFQTQLIGFGPVEAGIKSRNYDYGNGGLVK